MKQYAVLKVSERLMDFLYRERHGVWRAGPNNTQHASGVSWVDSTSYEFIDWTTANVFWCETEDDSIQLCAELAHRNPGTRYFWLKTQGQALAPPGEIKMSIISDKGIIPR